MRNQVRRGKGTVQKLGGQIKRAVGKALGNDRMRRDGAAEQVEGHARESAAKGTERGRGKADEIIGKVKHRVGRAVGNDRLAIKGKARELKGRARQALSR